ncbi:hypothetical protein [Dysgonomonas sp. 520]|uniref:hypothetical protein n=1 Tax=Dysgonomonas sp. 520 TaxID=2302931 RepID=UPI0013D6F19F|nr:hypothetical protein [Dysgonomonas sp. 520]NDW11061.1 hypothetical protein [Dysgonomonas sp. 520]
MRNKLFISCLLVLFTLGCSNNIQKDFDQALEIAVRNDDVKDAQWKNLLEKLDIAQKNGTVLVQKVKTKEDLINYIWDNYPNINGSTVDLIRKVVKIDTINIYLENSSSMAGYFPVGGNLKFTAPIIDMYNLGTEKTAIQTYYIGNGLTQVDPIRFRKDLSDGRVSVGKSSPLADIFEKIIEDLGKDQVSFLITDAIMSGTNEEVARNKEYNYIHRPELRQTIRETFQKAREKGLSLVVYRFQSSFNGVYYDYRNSTEKRNIENRPFFIFALGNPENLNLIMKNARMEKEFKPTHQLLIGIYISPVTSFKFKSVKGVEYIANQPQQLISYKSKPTKMAEIGLRVDLANLPGYMQNLAYLNKNLRLSTIDHSSKKAINCNEYIDSVEEINATTGEYQINILLPMDYLVTIPNSLTVTLISEPNTWYEELSLEKDDKENFEENKTFALNYMIEGMLMGLGETELPNAIDFTVKIKQ